LKGKGPFLGRRKDFLIFVEGLSMAMRRVRLGSIILSTTSIKEEKNHKRPSFKRRISFASTESKKP